MSVTCSKSYKDILDCEDEEFNNKLTSFAELIRESLNNQIIPPELRLVITRCLNIIKLKMKDRSYPKDAFSNCVNIVKCINETFKKYDPFNIFDHENIEILFKLTSILNDNELVTDSALQIQCLHSMHILVSSDCSKFMILFEKFHKINMIKNFFKSVEIKLLSLSWKLLKRIIQKDKSRLLSNMKDLLLEIILDTLNADFNLKIKNVAADVFLNILILHDVELTLLTKEFDSIQVLLNQVHFEHQEIVSCHKIMVERFSLLAKYLWCLLQLIIDYNEKQFFRDIGGIPIILGLLRPITEDSDIFNSNKEQTSVGEKYFQIIEAASTVISALSKNENCNLEIVQKSGIYLLAQFLVSIPRCSRGAEALNKQLFRALRFLFSLERNRKIFKNLFPVRLYEAFVDIGHFCEELNDYNQLITIYCNLSDVELRTMKESIDLLNHKEETKCIRDYIILELLGSGAFGSVYKAKRKKASPGSYCAIKEVNLSEYQIGSTSQERCDSIYQIASELDIIKKQLRHPHVVRYYRTFNDAQNLYVVMAFLEGISLGEQINCMKEKREMYEETRILRITLQLIQALRYLHKSKGIIHRDLTPYNIIIGDNDYVTITDFGLAKQRLLESRGREARSILGTLTYVCPEVIQHHPYGEKADIWALGCIVYQMCTLTQPFTAQSELDLVNKICLCEYVTLDNFISPFTESKLNYSSKIQEFIRHSIVLDPHLRYDVLGLANLFTEEMLIYLDETENLFNKEKQIKKSLESQINEINTNKFLAFDMPFHSLQGSSREASPSVSSVNNQNLDDLNAESGQIEKTFLANSPDLKSPDISNPPNSGSLSLSFNKNRISKISSFDSPNLAGQFSDLNLKRLHLQTSPSSEVKVRSFNFKSLMSISQKSLRHIAEDPITRILTWLHKIHFLSRADFTILKTGAKTDNDLIQTKRYFKTIFEFIFKLQPNQMKIELNNMISGRDSPLQMNAFSSNIGTKFPQISPESLHYLMDDLLEKLNY